MKQQDYCTGVVGHNKRPFKHVKVLLQLPFFFFFTSNREFSHSGIFKLLFQNGIWLLLYNCSMYQCNIEILFTAFTSDILHGGFCSVDLFSEPLVLHMNTEVM